MNFSFTCPNCEQKLEADASWSGMETPCPKCDTAVTIPQAEVGAGVTLGGFKVTRALGRGGMGTVYLARQLSMDRNVALKVLSPQLSSDRQFVDRFMREVRVLAMLEHPNIVAAHEAGEDSGHYYLAMAYVDGESLDVRLRHSGPLPEQQALQITRTVAQALSYAWKKHQLLHRDIKPANIMVDREGQVKLMDVGISKSLTEETALTMTGALIGTPNYMSPEQARNAKGLDFRADIYSLGATLYHLVTGRAPFQGTSSAEVVTQVLRDPLPSPRVANPDVSLSCADLLTTMMAKDPEQRPASWDALVTDMSAVLGGDLPLTAPLAADRETVVSGGTPPAQTARQGARADGGTAQLPPESSIANVAPPAGRRSAWRRVLRVAGYGALTLVVLLVLATVAKGRKRRQARTAAGGNVSAAQAVDQAVLMEVMSKLQAQRRNFYDAIAADLVRLDFDAARQRVRKLADSALVRTRAGDIQKLGDWITKVEEKVRELQKTGAAGSAGRAATRRPGMQDDALTLSTAHGLLLIKAQRYEGAIAWFQRLEGPLRPALVAQAKKLQAEHGPEGVATSNKAAERTGKRPLKWRHGAPRPEQRSE